MSNTFKFYGGVHPSQSKIARTVPIADAPLFPTYTVPLQMHIGAPAKLLFAKGDKVLRGDLLGAPDGFVSAPVHAPTSGTIKEITTCLNVSGTKVPAVVLESDGEDRAGEMMPPIPDWQNADPAVLRKRIGDSGIVGMGGAAFPSIVKLSPTKAIDTLIINGVECEPCLTADHRLMLEHPIHILEGIQIIAKVLNVSRVLLGIENNKMDAVQMLQEKAQGTNVQVVPLNVRYPQGAEKQLIYALTGKKVPAGGLPMDVGCVVHNVASAEAIWRAVVQGIPLYERVSTVTGSTIVTPGNWHFRIGTSYADAIRLAGGVKEDPAKIISGGPMMGFSVYSLDIPITKSTSGILLMTRSEVVQYQSKSCLHCGRCNDACPMQMMPGILSLQIEHDRFDQAETWHVMDCIECGCCSYTCPAGRPLVQHMRRAKSEVRILQKMRQAQPPQK